MVPGRLAAELLAKVLATGFRQAGLRQQTFQHLTSCRPFCSAVAADTGTAAASWLRTKELLVVYKQLSKAKLSALVVSTAAAGYVAGSGETVEWRGLGWTALGTMATAACANTLNQVYEVANDSRMRRTMNRPLPLGRVSRVHALAFAATMGFMGLGILYTQANPFTAGLGGANILLYAGVYTPLKVVSAANTWVGALVGAVPPLMGWAAASGSLEPGCAVLALGLYFWQLPHFLSLAWLCRDDYMRGGYRMLPLYDFTGHRVAACALRNSLFMMPVGALAVWLGVTSPAFGYEAAIAAGTLATTSAVFYQKPSQRAARTLFRFSLLFLPVFMAGLLLHRQPNTHSQTWQDVHARLHIDSSVLRLFDAEARPVAPPGHGSLHAVSAAPFPLLPVPLQRGRYSPWQQADEAG